MGTLGVAGGHPVTDDAMRRQAIGQVFETDRFPLMRRVRLTGLRSLADRLQTRDPHQTADAMPADDDGDDDRPRSVG